MGRNIIAYQYSRVSQNILLEVFFWWYLTLPIHPIFPMPNISTANVTMFLSEHPSGFKEMVTTGRLAIGVYLECITYNYTTYALS